VGSASVVACLPTDSTERKLRKESQKSHNDSLPKEKIVRNFLYDVIFRNRLFRSTKGIFPVTVIGFLFYVGNAQADLIAVKGEERISLDFNGYNFDDARYTKKLIETLDGNPGDSLTRSFAFTTPVVTGSVSVKGDSHIAVSNVVITPSGVTYRETSIDGKKGTVTLSFDRISPNGITESVINGLETLRFGTNTTLGVGTFPMNLRITMPGDWSSTGVATGDHKLLSINPLWSIDRDFTFNGSYTTLSAKLTDYSNPAGSANLSFRLYGSPYGSPVGVSDLSQVSNVYGIFVGTYDGKSQSPIPFILPETQGWHADETARDLRQAILENVANAKAENLLLFDNTTKNNASLSNIESAISSLSGKITDNDLLIIYLGGHGGTSTENDELVTIKDANFNDSYVSDDLLTSWLQDLKTVSGENFQTWAFVDACLGGGFYKPDGTNDDGDLNKISNLAMIAAVAEDGLVPIGSFTETTNFGDSLVKAFKTTLTGSRFLADKQKDGLTIDDIFNYVDAEWQDYLLGNQSLLDEIVLSLGDELTTFEGQTTTLREASQFSPVMFRSADFDELVLVTSIPEPNSMLLIALCLGALSCQRWWRPKNNQFRKPFPYGTPL